MSLIQAARRGFTRLHPEDPHRAIEVLDSDLAKILKCDVETVAHMIPRFCDELLHRARHIFNLHFWIDG